MKEAEVSLRLALFYIKNNLAADTVKVSIDGAHIKVKNQVIFNLFEFLSDNGCQNIDKESKRWQGLYEVKGYDCRLEIHSRPGEGDVVVPLHNGETVVVECKGGVGNRRGNQEYRLIREAIGQLLTNGIDSKCVIPYVAVPFSDKNFTLIDKWSEYELLKKTEIGFFLVKPNDEILVIKKK